MNFCFPMLGRRVNKARNTASVRGLPRAQSGVTILEFVAFIGLAGIVTAGALGLYSTGNTGSKVRELAVGINSLVLSAKQRASDGVNTNIAATDLQVPSTWTKKTATDWTYDGATISFTNNKDGTFDLKVANLRSEEMVSQLSRKSVLGSDPKTAPATTKTGVEWKKISF